MTTSNPPHTAAPVSSATSAAAPPRFGRSLLMLALTSGILLSIPCLLAGPLAMDEYGTYWMAGDGPLTLWERSLNYENIPPLAPWIHRITIQLLGESELTFRLPNPLCYVIAIFVSYSLGREIGGSTFGGFVSLVTAWHPSALGEVMFARCYGVTYLFSALAFLFAIRWHRFPYDYRWAIGWTLACIALMWTHYLNAAVVIATTFVIVWRIMTFVRGAVFLVASFLLILMSTLPLYEPMTRMASWGQYFGYQKEAPLLETFGALWWAGMPAAIASLWMLSKRTTRMTQAAPVMARRIPRSTFVFLVCWGLVPSIFVAVFCRDEYASLANPRYRVGFNIAEAALCAALLWLPLKRSHSVTAVFVMLTVAWCCSQFSPWSPKRLHDRQSAQWKEIALKLQADGKPEEPVFVQSGFGEAVLLTLIYDDMVLHDYTACRLGRFYLKTPHIRYALPDVFRSETTTPMFYMNLIEKLREKNTQRVWLASATDTDLNQGSANQFTELMEANGYNAHFVLQRQDVILVCFSLPQDSQP